MLHLHNMCSLPAWHTPDSVSATLGAVSFSLCAEQLLFSQGLLLHCFQAALLPGCTAPVLDSLTLRHCLGTTH
jgi:hypothetical protein